MKGQVIVKKALSLLALTVVLAASLLLGSCKEKSRPIVVLLESPPVTLDPFNSVDHISPVVQQVIFEGLLSIGENNTLIPKLATSYEIGDDGLSITFTLRKGVKFHDGSDFDALAVKQNFEFLINPKNEMARRYLFGFIDSITVNSKYSITFTSKQRDYALAYYFAHPAAGIKSAKELDKRAAFPGYNLTHFAVGTGPYKLKLWRVPDQTLTLAPNTHYWDSANRPVSSIVFRTEPDGEQRLAMVSRGEVQVAYPVSSFAGANTTVIPVPTQTSYYVGVHYERLYKLWDPRIRMALNFALDREKIMVAGGFTGIPSASIASPTVFGHYAVKHPYNYDLNHALYLMDLVTVEPVHATLATPDTSHFVAMAEEIARQLKAVNVHLTVKAYPPSELYNLMDSGNYPDLWLGHYTPYSGEIHEVLAAGLRGKGTPEALIEAKQTPDLPTALGLYATMQERIYLSAHWLFLFTPTRNAVCFNSIEGMTVGPDGVLKLSGIKTRVNIK